MNSVLFSPVHIGPLALENRVVIAPMCQYSAQNGKADDWHWMHYGTLALSGAGLLIVEATAVSPEGRISSADLGLWSDETEEALGRMVETIRRYSSTPLCLQLAHAGRKASQYVPWQKDGAVPVEEGGWRPIAPSPLMYTYGSADGVKPDPMDSSALQRVRLAFANAAKRADRIGFNAVEVHMAHGYLLHEFLSPLSNERTDKFGDLAENRFRYPLQIFEAVRAAFPVEKPVGVRLSATDWVKGGSSAEESRAFALELQKRGSAYIHVSGGGLSSHQEIAPCPGYQVRMAADIRKELQSVAVDEPSAMRVIAVGLITGAEQAETILVSGQADLVALGRAMLYNPRWPWHAAEKLGAGVTAPPQYWRSAPQGAQKLFRKGS